MRQQHVFLSFWSYYCISEGCGKAGKVEDQSVKEISMVLGSKKVEDHGVQSTGEKIDEMSTSVCNLEDKGDEARLYAGFGFL